MSSKELQPKHSDTKKTESHLSQLASVGEIAAGIAHEVRSPLTAVKGFLQLLEKQNPHSYIDVAQNELENALSTLENLLQVSKPDQENESLSSFHIVAEIESILNLFMDQQHRVEIKKTFKDTDVLFYGKRNQMKKALFNLFKNAFEAIEHTGVTTIEQYVENDQIYIKIQDTGVGIPEEKLSNIGTPFFSTKEEGTGMGVAQVFSAIYEHGGSIQVDSKEGKGTKFTISIPKENKQIQKGLIQLDLDINDQGDIKTFFTENRKKFEEHLLSEAVNVKDKIDEIYEIGNIDLVGNAFKIVLYVAEGKKHELMMFAKQAGQTWAENNLTLAFKLEWLQSVRRVLWDFLYNYDRLEEKGGTREEFFQLEKSINDSLDDFLDHFFVSYTQYKDQLLQSQRQMIDNLTIPVIPLTNTMSILPLIGEVDYERLDMMKQKTFEKIHLLNIETLIIDFSGTSLMEAPVSDHLFKILDGITAMGCKPVITGVRPEVVNHMIDRDFTTGNRTETRGTLQQALEDFL